MAQLANGVAGVQTRVPDAEVDAFVDSDALRAAAVRSTEGLRRGRPAASAAFGLIPAQRAAVAGTAIAATLGAVFAPAAFSLAAAVIVGAGFVAAAAFRLAAAVTPPPKPAPGGWLEPPPIYTILAPLYREAEAAPGLAAALAALDYPAERLDVKFLVEADDGPTRAIAETLAQRYGFDMIVCPEGEPRTKPRALNIGLAFARGDFVTIYDAEDRPRPDQLRAALDAFASGRARLACVQAPLRWWNADESFFTRQLAIEYAVQFHVVLPALARWGWPAPLGGTSNHFRRSALDAVGGWDPFNVTEDADLGFRLAADGWRFGVITPPTDEEAVTTARAWTRQRTRWLKGFMQTWGVRMRDPIGLVRGAGLGGLLSLQATIGVSIASAALHAPCALASVIAIIGGVASNRPAAALSAAGLAIAAWAAANGVAFVGLARAGRLDLWRSVLIAPIYWPLHTWAAARAAIQLVRAPYAWEKTAHGVSRWERQDSWPKPPARRSPGLWPTLPSASGSSRSAAGGTADRRNRLKGRG